MITLQSAVLLCAQSVHRVCTAPVPLQPLGTRTSDTMNVSLQQDKLHIFPQDEKPAVTEKGLYLQRHTACSPTLHTQRPREEEVAAYRIQTWGEMVYIAITRQYSKWWIQRATSPLHQWMGL